MGLAYDAWAPVGDDGKVPDTERAGWLSALAGTAVSTDYRRAYECWKASFRAPSHRVFELMLASRLLIGHGNSSAIDIGLTVHHTWGVPVIPGSALKGLLAHYVDAVYGPDDPSLPLWEQVGEAKARADYQGITWRSGRIERGPGAVYRALFGAPDAKQDDEMRTQGFDAGASAGAVVFHDALYVPGSVTGDRPYAADVLTVHQKEYYNSEGKSPPNDYDDPNPVAFLTVRPGARLLFALSGPEDWTALAERLLRDALERWGVGGKTSAGYGRVLAPEQAGGVRSSTGRVTPPRIGPAPKPGDRVEATLLEARTKKGGWKARHLPTGLAGPIQNSADVPPDKKPGDAVKLIVATVSAHEMHFRYPTRADEQRAAKPKTHRNRPPPGTRR
ncbi:MAG TPA: type III-B CRISPR module RAMP protein Cmr6 [Hyphomicrobiaceae bacterium]|nr:type III-B CRISPR module RAMP protein Cmr6 [Hyphomicrobiaceae bacterium]